MQQMTTLRSWPGWLLVIGGMLWVVGVRAVTGEWGPPGTAAYNRYQWANRFLSVPLLLLLVGNVAVHRYVGKGMHRWRSITVGLMSLGYGLMILGSVAEFWLFTTRSYSDPLRGAAWGSFVIGVLIVFVGTALDGVAMWTRRPYPRWLAAVTMVVPIGIFAGLVLLRLENPSLIMGLSLWAVMLGAWYLWSSRTLPS